MGSSTTFQKVKSLTQRWFKASESTIEKLPSKNILGRDYIFQRNGTFFRILCIFKNHTVNGVMMTMQMRMK